MARTPKKQNGKKRGPKKGSKHSRQHNSAIAEGMKKYWATKGKRRSNKSKTPNSTTGRRKPKQHTVKTKKVVRYLTKRR